MTAQDLNLDAMADDDLEAFAVYCGTCRCRAHVARELFPTRPAGYRRAASGLSHYAWNTLTARRCRANGEIDTARMYEDIADRIYRELPAWAKGW